MLQLQNRIARGIRTRIKRTENNIAFRFLSRRVAGISPKVGEAPVVFFNASTRLGGVSLNAGFSILSSLAVQLAGVPVVHFVCQAGMISCVLGTDRDNPGSPPPCRECLSQSRSLFTHADVRWFQYSEDSALSASLMRLNLDQLVNFVYHDLPLGELVLPSVRWILRRHHLLDDEPTRAVLRNYIASAWSVYGQFNRLLDDLKPRAVVVFNGMFFPEAAARRAAAQRNIPVVSHEVGLRPFTGFFTTGDATAYPMEIPESFQLDDAMDKRLDDYLEQRFRGNFSMAGVRFWPEMRFLTQEFWQRAGLFDQIVPVFTNVIFDTSQGHANVVFDQMFAWLEMVEGIIRDHPETYFVIRAHPDESRPGKESRESVAEWVSARGLDKLKNVLFVGPDEYFSSYELIQRSKFVMVYNSTIGLEATILRAPVLCGGKARFTQLPTVFFPESPKAYRKQAEAFLNATFIDVPPEFRDNARRLLYYQLFKTSLPFDTLLEEDGIYQGYVALKTIPWQNLLPEKSPTLKTIVNGVLHGGKFILEEAE
jgi:hypothetical protein